MGFFLLMGVDIRELREWAFGWGERDRPPTILESLIWYKKVVRKQAKQQREVSMKALGFMVLGLFVASGCVVERYYPVEEDTNEGDAGKQNNNNNSNNSSVAGNDVTDADNTDPANTVSVSDTGSETVSTVPVDTGSGEVLVDTGTGTGVVFDTGTGSAVDTIDTGVDTGIDTGIDTTSFVDTVDTGVDTDTRPDCEFVCVNKGTCPASGVGGEGIPHREMSCGEETKVCCDDHSQDPIDTGTFYPDCAYECVESSQCSGDAWESGYCETGICCSDYFIDTGTGTGSDTGIDTGIDTGSDTGTGSDTDVDTTPDIHCVFDREYFETPTISPYWSGDWCQVNGVIGGLPAGILIGGHMSFSPACVYRSGTDAYISLQSKEYFLWRCADVNVRFTYWYNVYSNETISVKLIGNNGTSFSIIPYGNSPLLTEDVGNMTVSVAYDNLLPGATSFHLLFEMTGRNSHFFFDNLTVFN